MKVMKTAGLNCGGLFWFFLRVQQPTQCLVLLTDFTVEQISFSRGRAAVGLVPKGSRREEALIQDSSAVLSDKGHEIQFL